MDSKEYIKRLVEEYAFDETLTGRHMVFLAGPRQVGKTILAKNWLKKKASSSVFYARSVIHFKTKLAAQSEILSPPI
jgi:predicted AAA+ superfamily ATPase